MNPERWSDLLGSVPGLVKCLIAWRISLGRGVRMAFSRSFFRHFLVSRIWRHDASCGLLLNIRMLATLLS